MKKNENSASDWVKFVFKFPVYLFCLRSGRKLLSIAFLVALGMIFFAHFGPQRFKPSPLQRRIGTDLVQKAVDRFPWDREVGTVKMISDCEAWEPFFTNAIRARVTDYSPNGGRKFDILPDSFINRILRALRYKTAYSALSDEQIARICTKMEADTLLLVRFGGDDYTEDENHVTGRLKCLFYSKQDRSPIVVDVCSAYDKKTHALDPVSHYFGRMNVVGRFVWFVLGVVLFPFLMAPVTLVILRRSSARVNALMVFFYSIFIFAVAGILLPAPRDIVGGLIWCVGGIAVVGYLLKICDKIASPGFRRRLRSN